MPSSNDPLIGSLSGRLTEELARHGVPGGAATLCWEDRELSVSSGVSSARTQLPVTAETLFRVGSLTKVLVATALMLLVQDGKVTLEDPVVRHVPNFALADAEAASTVTIADVLSHRGGWQGDFIDFTGENDDALALHVQHMRGLPQIVPPGQQFSYSNTGYCVLGRIIESVTQEPFESALRHLVLEAYGVREARFSAAETITGWFSVGHALGDSGAEVMDQWELPRGARPAGGLIATPGGLARFAAAFAADGGPLASETRELMSTPRVDAIGTENLGDQFGLGWFIRDADGARLISHGGAVLGQHALMLAVPGARFAITVTANSEGGDAVCESVCRWALSECLQVAGLGANRTEEASQEAKESIAGRYESALSNVEIECLADGALRLTAEPRPLAPGWPALGPTRASKARLLTNDVLLLSEGPLSGSRARVVRSDDGGVAYVRFEGRLAVPGSAA